MNEIMLNKSVDESKVIFSSIKTESFDDKLKVLKMTNTPDFRIKDFVNLQITIKDIFIESVSVRQEDKDENGNVKFETCPRVIIIDEKGKSYVAVSFGVFSAIKRLIEMLGSPDTWEHPIVVNVKQITKGERTMLTFEPNVK